MMTGTFRIGAALTATLACAVLGGCSKTPEGQVVATVNGDEVTRRDLTSELAATGNSGVDEAQMKQIQPVVVEGIVNRKLLVQEAERSNLDKDPQYLALKQRADEILLAQMLAQSWTGKLEKPSPAAVRAFVTGNPLMFGERKAILVDEIATAAANIPQAQLATMASNDAVAAWLSARKKPFQRGDKAVDTMKMPQPLAARLVAKAGDGGPTVVRNGPMLNILAVRAVRPMPVPQNQWSRLATEALQQQAGAKTTDDQLKRLRETADVSYLPEFAPPGDAAQTKQ